MSTEEDFSQQSLQIVSPQHIKEYGILESKLKNSLQISQF
jgi:hypothetical protein